MRKRKDESIFDWFARRVMLVYNIIGAVMSITFLSIMVGLGHKNLYMTIALISLAVINLSVAFIMFFTYSRTKTSKTIKMTKASIKFLKLLITLVSFGLSISMWFTKFSHSPFMTALVIVYTCFYGVSMAVQVLLLFFRVKRIYKRKGQPPKKELQPPPKNA